MHLSEWTSFALRSLECCFGLVLEQGCGGVKVTGHGRQSRSWLGQVGQAQGLGSILCESVDLAGNRLCGFGVNAVVSYSLRAP